MSVSLMAANLARDPEGLCSARFRADIETNDIDYAALAVGDVVAVDGASYRITGVGKRCHPECALVQSGRTCQLRHSCAFAERI